MTVDEVEGEQRLQLTPDSEAWRSTLCLLEFENQNEVQMGGLLGKIRKK